MPFGRATKLLATTDTFLVFTHQVHMYFSHIFVLHLYSISDFSEWCFFKFHNKGNGVLLKGGNERYYWRVNERFPLFSIPIPFHCTILSKEMENWSVYYLKDSVLSILLLYSPILSPNSERDSIMSCAVKSSFNTGSLEITHKGSNISLDKNGFLTLQFGDHCVLNLDSVLPHT